MRGLVEWIEQQAPARVRDRVVEAPGGGKRGRQARECRCEFPLQDPGGGLLPAVKGDAVAQAEAGQEIVSIQPDRGAQSVDLAGTAHGHCRELAEAADVDRLGRQRDGRAFDP